MAVPNHLDALLGHAAQVQPIRLPRIIGEVGRRTHSEETTPYGTVVRTMWFDGQAAQFDDLAGLEPAAARTIAQAVLNLGGGTGDDILLDVGAGTGTVSSHFADLRVRYLGLDRSRPMLEIFRRKLVAWPQSMLLIQADGNCPWPIRDHAVSAVFASRVAHHLEPQHFVHEVFRVSRPGGRLLLGEVTRDGNSLPSCLRRYKRTLLAEHGLCTPAGSQVIQQIVEDCRLSGANLLPSVTVAHWRRTTTAARLLAAWEGKPQLSSSARGRALPAEQRAAVLHKLTEWARREFGDLECPQEFAEAYVLQAVRLP